jgi:cytochrome P450
MIESQIIVGTLVAKFRARLADPAPVLPEPRVTLRTSRPVLLRLERRTVA